MNQAKELSPTAKPAVGDPVRGVMPVAKADNLSVAGRQPVNTTGESITFITISEVEAMLRKKKEKVSHL